MAIDWQELLKQAFAGNGGMAPVPTPRPDAPPALTPMGVTPEPEKRNPIAGFFSSKDEQGNERHGSHFARIFQEDPDKQDALSNGLIQMGAAIAMAGAPSTNPASGNFLNGLGVGIAQGNKAYTQYGQDQADLEYKKAQVAAGKQKLAAAEQQKALINELFGGGSGSSTPPVLETGSSSPSSDAPAPGNAVAANINSERSKNERLYVGLAKLGNDDLAGKAYTQMHYMDNQMADKGFGWDSSKQSYVPLPGFVQGQRDIEEAKSSGRKAGEAPFETTTDITNFKFAQEHPAFIDPAKQRADAAKSAADEKAADDARQTSQDTFKNEQDLRKEYQGNPVYKNYTAVRGSFERIQSGAARNTGAGDLGIIYGYMKMLDPGSVVREGEFATAENASGVPTYVSNLYNKLLNGERLTDGQRTEFVGAAKDLYEKERGKMDELNGQYTDIAKSKGIDFSKIVTEPKEYNKRQPPKAGDVFTTDEGKQVRFKGGNPNDKNNYEPVL